MSDPLCGASNRSGKGSCKRPAGWGTDHLGAGQCKLHAGSTRNGKVHGAAILAREDLARWVQPIPINPHDALLQAVYIAAGMVDYANEMVSALLEDELVGPVITTTTERADTVDRGTGELVEVDDVTTRIVTGAPSLHVWIRVRDDALDRLVRYSKVCIDAGIAERQVELAERQGRLIVSAISNILAALGVADHPEAPLVVRRELTAIAGTAVDGRAAA